MPKFDKLVELAMNNAQERPAAAQVYATLALAKAINDHDLADVARELKTGFVSVETR